MRGGRERSAVRGRGSGHADEQGADGRMVARERDQKREGRGAPAGGRERRRAEHRREDGGAGERPEKEGRGRSKMLHEKGNRNEMVPGRAGARRGELRG